MIAATLQRVGLLLGPARPATAAAVGVAVFVVLYVALDWASLLEPHDWLGITPWTPATGLGVAALLVLGPRMAPVYFIAVLATDALFRGIWDSPIAFISAALAISAGYALAASALRHKLGGVPRFGEQAHLLWLLVMALLAPVVIGTLVVGVFATAGMIAWQQLPSVVIRFWVGDVIGIAVMVPFLLLNRPIPDGSPARPETSQAIEHLLQAAAIALALWIIFGIESKDHFEYSYVLFMPLVWIALRHGLRGSVWGIVATQFGLALAMHLKPHEADVVIQFQLLMLAVTVTGLFLGSTVDQRRSAEGSLRESEARLQTVVRTAPDAILTFRPGGRIVSLNRAATEMFAIEADRESDMRELFPELAMDEANETAVTETPGHRPDGSTFPAEVSIGVAQGGGRNLLVAVARDISARKAAASRLKQREEELAQAMRLATTGEMAAQLAHEINQPLTAMIGFVRAAQGVMRSTQGAGPASGATHDLVDQAVQQALRAGDIIRTTRELIDRGDLHRVRTDLARLVEEVRDLIQPEAERRAVRLNLHVADTVPEALVDPTQIEQVMLNLLRNAIEAVAVGTGPRDVELEAMPSHATPGFIEVAVRDSGPGFDAAVVDRLFTPFSTTKQSGMGWGLVICRSIVEAHGGRIRVETDPDRGGACVRFTIPAFSDDADVD